MAKIAPVFRETGPSPGKICSGLVQFCPGEVSVSYLDRKVSQIEQLRTKELSQIEKLKEYKQRLISDVVTGKVKVIND